MDSIQKKLTCKAFTHSTLNKSANRLYSSDQKNKQLNIKNKLVSGFKEKFVSTMTNSRLITASTNSPKKLKIPFSGL